MKKKFSILTLLLFCSVLLFADSIKFTVQVSKTQVGTGEVFEVAFAINGGGERFTPPSFSGFQVVSGPNVSNSMSIINGVTSSSTAYSYDLVALHEGDYTIAPASISVNGKTYSTGPVKIKVVKGRAAPQNSQQQAQQNGPDNSIHAGHTENIAKSLFMKAVVDKTDVYLGQQLSLTFRLYTRVGIVGNELEKMPDLNGFYGEEIKNDNPNAQWRTEVYKGLKYNVTDIKQTILFPQHEGDIIIDPVVMTFVVRQQAPSSSGDPFDSFFGSYEDVKYKIKSAPVVIHVKPLPAAGKPAGFSGAVGNFTIAASLDKNDIKANDAINYRFKVTGSGSLKLLKPVAPDFPADFEKYDPKITDTITEQMSGVSGSRLYNYLLIPRHGGNFTIEPVKFSFFNPAAGKYVTLTSKAFSVKVTGGAAENNVTAYAAGDKEDVKMLDKDIRYIKTGSISDAGGTFYGSALFYLLLIAGPALFAGALVYGKWNNKNNSDIVKLKSRKAGKIAAKHLASARQQLAAHNKTAFYEDLFRGLYGYLGDKLNIPYADLNREKIAAELGTRLLDASLTTEMLDTLDLCEMARYAPVSGISEQQVFDKAQNLINNIENKI